MANLLAKLIGDRKEWKRMEARANALPREYRVVYEAYLQKWRACLNARVKQQL